MGPSMVDCRVGTIVWVRRKNGSWWPGRIVEAPPSNRFSPRIGTPIKFLSRGRENSHVDWYNLEKSKRVKAFRCGEFDDCIRRAESFKGYPSADCSNYERREDAILYALELEMQELIKKLKRPTGTSREERVGSVYRAKRSRCIYLPAAESNNFYSERKFSHPQPLKVSSSSVVTPIQCGSADKKITCGSMEFKSCNSDSWNEKRDEAVKGSHNEQFVSMNSVEQDELGYLSEEHTWNLKKKVKIRNLNKMSGVKGDEQRYLRSKNGTQDREDTLNPTAIFEDKKDVIMLIDADIKVQASYRGEHVPLVSLMSRLNGKAIVGHPIDMEAIEEGLSETGPLKNDDFALDLFDDAGSTLLKLVWRTTCRRTPVCYAPNLEDNSSTLNGYKSLKSPSFATQKTKTTLCAGGQKHCVTGGDVKATRPSCVPVNHIFSKLLIAIGGLQK